VVLVDAIHVLIDVGARVLASNAIAPVPAVMAQAIMY
jgi:hypothetical protein